MSLRICSAEFMVSESSGTGFSGAWLPTLAAESFVTSGKDGAVDRSPDQVPFIDAEMLWTNSYDDPVYAMASIGKAPRSIVTSTPNTLVLDDAYSWDIAVSPSAPTPFGANNGSGERVQNSPTTIAVGYLRYFRDFPDAVSYVSLGEVDPGESVHFRYRCLFSTPGNWRAAVQPLFLAYARYARLRLWVSPWTTGSVV